MFKARNLAISMAAGNATIWKPSQTTPLSSIAVTKIISGVLERNGIPGAVASLVMGDKYAGEALVESRDIDMGTLDGLLSPLKIERCAPIVSFTGSETVGKAVGRAVQSRFGKVLLELGGNNGYVCRADRQTRC